MAGPDVDVQPVAVNADLEAVTRAMAAMLDRQIVIDPRASADACRGPIFANDFE